MSYRNGIELGTLLCKVNSDRWIVRYKNNNLHEQQVSQKSFGRLLNRNKPSSDSNDKRKRSLRNRRAKELRSTHDSSVSNSTVSNNSRKIRKGKKRRKPEIEEEKETLSTDNHNDATNDNDNDNDNDNHIDDTPIRKPAEKKPRKSNASSSDSNNPTNEPQLSAREKRLRMRREAAGEEFDEPSIDLNSKKKSGRNTGGWKGNSSKKEKEEVVKVKMNTGTLYLYRGENPRAVFVRKY